MNVRPYNSRTDKEQLLNILAQRGMPATTEIPTEGMVAVDDDGTLVAFGGVRAIDTTHLLVDSYVTRPDMDSFIRNQALEQLTSRLIKLARHRGYKGMICITKEKSIESRAIAHGFTSLPDYKILTKPL